MTATSTAVRASVKETAAALRKTLKETFPGTKFSVTMASGTAYGWLRVSYTDGPSWDSVQDVTRMFESERFDGMTDSYVSTGVSGWDCSGVNVTRNFSEEALAEAEAQVQFTTDGWAFVDDGEHLVSARYPNTTTREMAQTYLMRVSI